MSCNRFTTHYLCKEDSSLLFSVTLSPTADSLKERMESLVFEIVLWWMERHT